MTFSDMPIMPSAEAATADVLILNVDESLADEYAALKHDLNVTDGDLVVEIYTGEDKLGKQLKYADQAGIPIVLILGYGELGTGMMKMKDLRRSDDAEGGNERTISREHVVAEVRAALATPPVVATTETPTPTPAPEPEITPPVVATTETPTPTPAPEIAEPAWEALSTGLLTVLQQISTIAKGLGDLQQSILRGFSEIETARERALTAVKKKSPAIAKAKKPTKVTKKRAPKKKSRK